MKWSEYNIARAISLQTFQRKCVVLVDNCNWTGHECDVLAVTTDLRIIDVEVKISRADLKADAKKDKWWIQQWGHWADGKMVRPDPIARIYPPKVWKHYYALPKEIWTPELFEYLPSKASGVLLLSHIGEARSIRAPIAVDCIRRATPNKEATRLKPEQAMDIARLANLRMWEAYHRRDSLVENGNQWRERALAAETKVAA